MKYLIAFRLEMGACAQQIKGQCPRVSIHNKNVIPINYLINNYRKHYFLEKYQKLKYLIACKLEMGA